MPNRYRSILPERMIALSLLLPPLTYENPAPFGFGAFIVDRRWRREAAFSSHAHGYGAGYDPGRMRADMAKLFTPDTTVLIHTCAPADARGQGARATNISSRHLDVIPRSGLVRTIHAIIPHSELIHAARIGSLAQIPPAMPSPLQRLRHIRSEAEAAWLLWLFASSTKRLRRDLLAAHAAWRVLQGAAGISRGIV